LRERELIELAHAEEEEPAPGSEKEPAPRAPKLDFVLPFSSPAFTEAWKAWTIHRKEKKSKLTDSTIKLQLKKLVAIGEDRAIACIYYSIENGWTGLFESKADKTKGRRMAVEATKEEIAQWKLKQTEEYHHFQPSEDCDRLQMWCRENGVVFTIAFLESKVKRQTWTKMQASEPLEETY
jgi:hypothetical protein